MLLLLILLLHLELEPCFIFLSCKDHSWRSLAAGPHPDLESRARFLRLQALFHCFMEINIIVLETCMATVCLYTKQLVVQFDFKVSPFTET